MVGLKTGRNTRRLNRLVGANKVLETLMKKYNETNKSILEEIEKRKEDCQYKKIRIDGLYGQRIRIL